MTNTTQDRLRNILLEWLYPEEEVTPTMVKYHRCQQIAQEILKEFMLIQDEDCPSHCQEIALLKSDCMVLVDKVLSIHQAEHEREIQPILNVYEKYKDLDIHWSNKEYKESYSRHSKSGYDMWQAIKQAVEKLREEK